MSKLYAVGRLGAVSHAHTLTSVFCTESRHYCFPISFSVCSGWIFFPGCKPHKHNSVQLSLSGDGDQTSAHQHTFSATSSAIGITGMSNRFISFQWYSPVGYLSVMHKGEQELQHTHSCRLELNFWGWEQPNASFCAQVSDSYRVTQWFLKII